MDKRKLDAITFAVNGAVFEVNRILGSGFLEKVYERALIEELRLRKLKVENQVPLKVYYKGHVVGEFILDILVEGAVIVELKAVERLQKCHTAQILNYLNATKMSVGLLVNFTFPKAEIKRFVM